MMSDLTRARRLTEKMAKLREEHERLGRERGFLWYELTQPRGDHTYKEVAAACGVTESKITKAVAREKERHNGQG